MQGLALAVFAIFASVLRYPRLAMVYSSRYKKVGPNEVLIISGRGVNVADPTTGVVHRRTFRVVRGGGTFIWPVLERTDYLSLELMTIEIVTPNVYTLQGVPVTVDGVAQVKIGSDDVSIVTAAEQFLSKKVDEIQNVALQTLEGHLRSHRRHDDGRGNLQGPRQVRPARAGSFGPGHEEHGPVDRLFHHQEHPR